MKKKILYWLYETSIEMLKDIEEFSIKCNMLDDQLYIQWKDNLNALSIDVDRK